MRIPNRLEFLTAATKELVNCRYIPISLKIPVKITERANRRRKLVTSPDNRNYPVQGLISIGVPTPTSFQISSISSFVTATHPSVQSCRTWAFPTHAYSLGRPCSMMSPPAPTPNFLAAAMSFEFGYEMWKALPDNLADLLPGTS